MSTLYEALPTEKKEPCVWPFERLNVDTLGRIALCRQDVSFRTAELFPNLNDTTIKEIWQGGRFQWCRQLHLSGQARRLGRAATARRGWRVFATGNMAG